MSRWCAPWLAALAACGRIAFEEVPRTDADAAGDAPPDASEVCDLAADFGAPVPIAELNDPVAGDGTMRVLPDELGAYFWSRRGSENLSRIYYASRASRSGTWTVQVVTGLEDSRSDVDPTMAADGSLLVFRKSGPGDDLYAAIPTDLTTFELPVELAILNVGPPDTQPFLQPFGNELIFNSLRTGNGDLYRSFRTGTAFSAPQLITELQTTVDEGDPVLSQDGLTLYFRRNAAGDMDYDIFVVTRPTTADTFGAATLVPNVNSLAEDGPSSISADGCRLYMTSDRAGTYDLYVATRGQ